MLASSTAYHLAMSQAVAVTVPVSPVAVCSVGQLQATSTMTLPCEVAAVTVPVSLVAVCTVGQFQVAMTIATIVRKVVAVMVPASLVPALLATAFAGSYQ